MSYYTTNNFQKRFLLARAQGEPRWLKSLKPRQRRGLNFRLESTEKSSLEVLDFHDATLTFEGLNRPIIKGLEVGCFQRPKIGIVGFYPGKLRYCRLFDENLNSTQKMMKARSSDRLFHQVPITKFSTLTPVDQIRVLKPRMDYGDIRALPRSPLTSEWWKLLEKLSGGERPEYPPEITTEENNLSLLDELHKSFGHRCQRVL